MVSLLAKRLVAGVTIGVTLGAMLFSTFPIWLGVPTMFAITIVAILGDK